ncbi:gamma-glutamylcyclotransferase [Flindersiella endophytica]
MVYMFLNGGAMRGGQLHPLLCGAPLVAATTSAPLYRFFSVGDRFPAMDLALPDYAAPPRGAPGGATAGVGYAIAGEVYDVPLEVLRDSLLPAEPAELELGVIQLADGTPSLAMVLRRSMRGDPSLIDISPIGSWRDYLDST